MIGFDALTGKTILGDHQLRSRIYQVLTTPIGSRYKQRRFGSTIPSFLGKTTSDTNLVLVQAAVLEAFNNPVNGLSDFILRQVKATRNKTGINIKLVGHYYMHSQTHEFEFAF